MRGKQNEKERLRSGRISIQVLFRVILLFAGIAFFSAGCSRAPEIPRYDHAFLERMADLRSGSDEYALLISSSGLMACFSGDTSSQLPVEGVYLGSLRLLEGWSWTADDNRGKEEDGNGGEFRIRPDRFDWSIEEGVHSRLTLDPDKPMGLIELDCNRKTGAVLEPRFDFRPVGIASSDYSFEYDPERKILYAGSATFGYLAIASRAEFIPLERTIRAEYAGRYPPLDDAAILKIPGYFRFPPGKEHLAGFGVGRTHRAASDQAVRALRKPEKLRARAAERVIEALNRAPLFSEDEKLEAAAAWDRWLLINHRADFGAIDRFLPGPPLDIAKDPAVDARAMPGWFWATAGDSTVENMLDSCFIAAADSLPDPEGAILALNGWEDWLDLTGDGFALENRLKILARTFEMLGREARSNEKTIRVDGLSRWNRRLQRADLTLEADSTPPGLTLLFGNVLRRAVRWDRLALDWRNLYRRTSARTLVGGLKREIIINPIVKHDPFVWSDEEKRAWQKARDNINFNLGYMEYALLGDRRDPAWFYLGGITRGIWERGEGMVWREGGIYGSTVFTAPMWLARTADDRQRGMVDMDDYRALVNPRYAAWYTIADSVENTTRHGGSPEEMETISERVRFLYEVFLGLRPAPLDGVLYLAVPGTRDFWENRAVTVTVCLNGEQLMLDLDPFKGVYSVQRFGKNDNELKVDIRDVIINGTGLSVTARLNPRGVTEIRRGKGSDGAPTLLVNGYESFLATGAKQ